MRALETPVATDWAVRKRKTLAIWTRVAHQKEML